MIESIPKKKYLFLLIAFLNLVSLLFAAENIRSPARLAESNDLQLTVGQKETSQKQQETISTDTSGKEYVVGSEDVLEIQVWGNDDLQRTVEISQEGAFTFPLIGKIHAAGLSVFELEKLLKKLLADGYLREPQV